MMKIGSNCVHKNSKSVFTTFIFIIFTFLLCKTVFCETIQYVYDETGQLIKAIDSTGTVIEYVYDEVGNLLEIKRSTVSGLAIFNLSPKVGGPGTSVTIQGHGFSPTPTDNSVSFYNGVAATVTSATDNTLVVTVSAGAATGPISVTVGGNTATSTDDFIISQTPVISSITPNISLPDKTISTLTVTGSNLTGSTFSFLPDFVPPAMTLGPPTIDVTGTTATMSLTIEPNAVGTFTLVATNSEGSSSTHVQEGNTFRVLDPIGDEDNDGLTNAEEDALGTDMFDPDTDGDGLR